jgi:DNA-binding transcriptional LysR family regulator
MNCIGGFRMNINQIQSFVALYNFKSFTKAAEYLYITQPTISKNISSLEEELGVTLVERKKGGKIQITRFGEAYYVSFNEVLKTLDDTAFRIKYVLSNTKQIFRVGVMETWYLPDLIRMVNYGLPEKFQHIEFIFEFSTPGNTNLLVASKQLDFIFTIDPAYEPNKNYEKKKIVNIHSSLYTASINPAVENNKINIDKLSPEIFMITKQQITHTNIKQINDLFYPRKPIVKEVYSGQSVFMNVASGTGSAISDSFSINHFSKLTSSLILSNMIVPVIFAKKISNDSFYNEVSDYLELKILEWIEKKNGNY